MTRFERTMLPAEKAKAYFDRNGFSRMLNLVWSKYATWGKPTGEIKVKLAQTDECEAINEFFGTNYKPNEPIPIRLEVFQQELLDSAFPFTIPDLHQIMKGIPLLTKLEKDIMRQAEWKRVFIYAKRDQNEWNPFIINWLQKLEECIAQGYRTLLEQFEEDPEQAIFCLRHVIKSLEILLSASTKHLSDKPAGLVRLPYLAVIAAGDSHALDLKRPAGRLLYYALRERRFIGMVDKPIFIIEEEPQDDEVNTLDTLSIREAYRSAGIADDDLSPIVHIYIPESGKSPIPTVLTLRQVEAMEQFPSISALYVVENPPVFSMLLDATAELIMGNNQDSLSSIPPILVCSSGPASAAALRLFQRMIERSEHSFPIYYSGDYDVKGLEMGAVLANRFPAQFSPWRFDATTYLEPVLNCPNGPEFSQTELNRLIQYKVPWNVELTLTMNKKGHKVFQETLMPLLIRDWINAIGSEKL
jgi:uncharacterized protein (TIGR02679 family)